jgi:hypothetical protein
MESADMILKFLDSAKKGKICYLQGKYSLRKTTETCLGSVTGNG